MRLLLAASAALVLSASPLTAGSGFARPALGAGGGGSVSPAAEFSIAGFFLSAIKAGAGKAASPSRDKRSDSGETQYKCDADETAEDTEASRAEASRPSGPEPLYLAF